jgi:hypothetical protein
MHAVCVLELPGTFSEGYTLERGQDPGLTTGRKKWFAKSISSLAILAGAKKTSYNDNFP